MFLEMLFGVGVCVAGAAIAAGIFYILFGKNVGTKVLTGLIPGVSCLMMAAYVWGKLGGVHMFSVTVIAVPIGIIAFAFRGHNLVLEIITLQEGLHHSDH